MMYDALRRKQYKRSARDRIRGAFWPTIATALLEMIPLGLIAMIYQIGLDGIADDIDAADIGKIYTCLVVYLLATLFIGAPIEFGAKHYYVARARGEAASPALVFSCFASGAKYLTSIKLMLCILLRSLGWVVLLLAYSMLLMLMPAAGVIGWLVLIFGSIGLLCLALLVFVKIRRYDGAYIRMIDRPEGGVMEAVKSCGPTFAQHNWELLVFDLSFLLWDLLSAVTLGIVSLYVTPYQEIAFVNCFDELSGVRRVDEPDVSPEAPEE